MSNTYPETLELAMLAAQGDLTNPIKDANNPHFKAKYASLPEIRNLVTPILARHGLYIMQLVNGDTLQTTITHAPSKAAVTSSMSLIMDKATPQGQGSAVTYARRYSLCAMLNIAADEDDDGNGASQSNQPKPKAETKVQDKDRKPMPDDEFNTFSDAINNATTIENLAKVFKEAQDAGRKYGDKPAIEGFVKLKDLRKKELTTKENE